MNAMDQQKQLALTLITKSRIRLMRDHPFFGSLVMRLQPVESPDVPTIGVDDDGVLLFNKDFVVQQQQFLDAILVHEILHLGLEHHWLFTKVNQSERMLLNIATDAVINDCLCNEYGFKFPEGAILPDSSRSLKIGDQTVTEVNKKTAWDVFLLIRNMKNQMSQVGNGAGTGNGFDDHSRLGRGQKGTKPGGGSNQSGNGQNGKTSNDGMNPKVDWKQVMIEAAIQHKQNHGSDLGWFEWMIDKLTEPPKMDWYEILQRAVSQALTSDWSWSHPSKRSTGEFIFPGLRREPEYKVGIAIDTSCSMSDSELRRIISCVKELHDKYRCSLIIYCGDVRVTQRFEISSDSDLLSEMRSLLGRGGTDFRPTLEAFENESDIELVVYFTDGEGDYPEKPPRYRIIWALTSEYNVPFGEVVKIGKK